MKHIVYYNNGQVWSKCFLVNGKIHGEYIEYYKNGQVHKKCFVVNEKMHGEYIEYYDDGSVDWHRLYVDGNMLIDLKESPVCNEEKMLLSLEHGVEWL
jgi:antitoxin component YwqK of YwqJK toxin-antitoxin module